MRPTVRKFSLVDAVQAILLTALNVFPFSKQETVHRHLVLAVPCGLVHGITRMATEGIANTHDEDDIALTEQLASNINDDEATTISISESESVCPATVQTPNQQQQQQQPHQRPTASSRASMVEEKSSCWVGNHQPQTNPYGYEIVAMDGDNFTVDNGRSKTPPRKRRRYQRRHSKTPAMLRATANAPLLLRLDLVEDEKDHLEESFTNLSLTVEESSSSAYDSSFNSSWASLAVETAEEIVTKVRRKHSSKRKFLDA